MSVTRTLRRLWPRQWMLTAYAAAGTGDKCVLPSGSRARTVPPAMVHRGTARGGCRPIPTRHPKVAGNGESNHLWICCEYPLEYRGAGAGVAPTSIRRVAVRWDTPSGSPRWFETDHLVVIAHRLGPGCARLVPLGSVEPCDFRNTGGASRVAQLLAGRFHADPGIKSYGVLSSGYTSRVNQWRTAVPPAIESSMSIRVWRPQLHYQVSAHPPHGATHIPSRVFAAYPEVIRPPVSGHC